MNWGPGELWGCHMSGVQGQCISIRSTAVLPVLTLASSWTPSLCPMTCTQSFTKTCLPSQCHANLALFILPLLAVLISQQDHGIRRLDDLQSPPIHMVSYVPKHDSNHITSLCRDPPRPKWTCQATSSAVPSLKT